MPILPRYARQLPGVRIRVEFSGLHASHVSTPDALRPTSDAGLVNNPFWALPTVGSATCVGPSNISAANEFPGSQVGSQRRQAPGDVRPHPARVAAGERHADQHLATSSNCSSLHGISGLPVQHRGLTWLEPTTRPHPRIMRCEPGLWRGNAGRPCTRSRRTGGPLTHGERLPPSYRPIRSDYLLLCRLAEAPGMSHRIVQICVAARSCTPVFVEPA
jgi:hypothetical protein